MKNIRFSAILFGVLTLWQTLLSRYVIGGASLTQVPLFLVFESLAVLALAAVTLWLIQQPDTGLSSAAKRAVVTGGILYAAFVLINVESELMIVQYGLSTLGEAFTAMPLILGALAVKALLVLSAVVFAVLPEKAAATKAEQPATEAQTIAQEVMAEADEAIVAESMQANPQQDA